MDGPDSESVPDWRSCPWESWCLPAGSRAFESWPESGADFIPMAPNTAIGFILLGCALAANPAEFGDRPRRLIVAVTSAIVLVLATIRLFEYALSVDLGVNGWFFRAPAEMFGLAPVGRMSLFTALIFELASVSVLGLALNGGQSNRDWAGVGGLAVALFGAVFVLGYCYAAPLFYGGSSIPMALTTAMAFVLLGIGQMAAAGRSAFPIRLLTGSTTRARLLAHSSRSRSRSSWSRTG